MKKKRVAGGVYNMYDRDKRNLKATTLWQG
jgi:hypothetical protein